MLLEETMPDTRLPERNPTKDGTGYQRHLVEKPFDGRGDVLDGFLRWRRSLP